MSTVDDLDPSMVLAAAAATERESRMVELRRLELAVQWCVLHPATQKPGWPPTTPTPPCPACSVSTSRWAVTGRRRWRRSPRNPSRRDGHVPGRRCAAVGRRTRPHPPPPRLWHRVQALHDAGVAGPPGRRTDPPTLPGSGPVGRHRLAHRDAWGRSWSTGWWPRRSRGSTPRNTPPRGQGQGVLGRRAGPPRPDGVRRDQRAACPRRHPGPDSKFYDLVGDTAPHPSPIGARCPQGGAAADPSYSQAARRLAPCSPSRAALVASFRCAPSVNKRRLGSAACRMSPAPATLAKIKEWVGHAQVTIQPVLDMGRGDAVDRHDPPAWMREIVILRDRHWCSPAAGSTREPATRTTSTRTSTPATADHPTKPAQNLACLCRRTTEPRPPASGDTNAPPTATATSGTDPTVRRLVTLTGTITVPTN